MSTYAKKDCLYSVVKNVSGGTLTCSWLPPHGKQLAANATYTVFGSILNAINRNLSPGNNRRWTPARFRSCSFRARS